MQGHFLKVQIVMSMDVFFIEKSSAVHISNAPSDILRNVFGQPNGDEHETTPEYSKRKAKVVEH